METDARSHYELRSKLVLWVAVVAGSLLASRVAEKSFLVEPSPPPRAIVRNGFGPELVAVSRESIAIGSLVRTGQNRRPPVSSRR